MIRFIHTFLLLIFFISVNAVNNKNDITKYVFWSDTMTVSWDMFKGIPFEDCQAGITSGIDYNYEEYESFLKMHIFSYMDLYKSRPSSCIVEKLKQDLLKHEIYHFKISELWARILSKKLDNKKFKRKSAGYDVFVVQKNVINLCREMQDQYDLETNHSKNKNKQIEWQQKIDRLLDKYKKYANKKVSIKLK